MNIDEEFARFIEFPEGSSGLYVTTVSAKLFAEHCIEQLKQDRDDLKVHNEELQRYNVGLAIYDAELKHDRNQLKAEVEALKPYKDNHIDLMNHMAEHDAEVIDDWLSQVRHMEGLSAHDIIESAEIYISELRQKAQDETK